MKKRLRGALAPLWEAKGFAEIVANVAKGKGNQLLYGLGGSQKPYLAAGLFRAIGQSCLYVTQDLQEAGNVHDDLAAFLSPEQVLLFPPQAILPYDFEAQSLEVASQRLRVLEALFSGDKDVMVVAPMAALLHLLPPPASLRGRELVLKLGDGLEWDGFLQELTYLGYERVPQVEGRGQFAVRGSIIDIFPPTRDFPYRLEFFANEVESIREFALADQLSRRELREVKIFPAREFILTPGERERGRERLAREGEGICSRLEAKGRGDLALKLRQRYERYLAEAEATIYFPGLDNLLPLYQAEKSTLFDYFPLEAVIFLAEPLRLKERVEEYTKQVVDIHSTLLKEGRVFLFQLNNYLNWEDVAAVLKGRRTIAISHFFRALPDVEPAAIYSLTAKDVPDYRANRGLVASDLERWLRRRYRVLLFADTEERGRGLQKFLAEVGFEADLVQGEAPPREGRVQVRTGGALTKGFEFSQLKLAILGGHDILGQQKARSLRRVPKKGKRIHSLDDLEPNDLVVHVNHGIGRYLGLKTMEIQGVQRDYLLVQYSGEDRLYVPTDQVHFLQKYVGVEGTSPRLSKLGGADWNRAKGRVKESVQELALGLLELYAARETVTGHSFAPDTVWQQEFEERFPHEETPDQRAAIETVKGAMEKPKPMDHIVCGDVGYGKTEVAIRAAFKAVMDGKQVAVLVPTTILAQQHYNTFQQRFEPYPVEIGLLSRFRTPAQQRETLKGLERGTVDIVIGTHRLLQRDIKFKDLGLWIIDEEQRFGVGQKEMLRKAREKVDVLTLTATPIPRTLHMAMAGIREMSLMETPPENRFPIQTYVLEHDHNLVRDAISLELRRGGQVFYVHNRIDTIGREAQRLQELCPGARIAVAHGQMGDGELEEVTMAFLAGDYDVLVCTTIIENGLDMPNVNTLIVTGADMMGLARLYQLRGRVGRSDRLAYAYFTYQKSKILSAAAEKRLQALREFTELGSGFKLALRDLEIRGAGNLLGAEQHGHIANIGFELYCQLLEEAVSKLKGDVKDVLPEPSLDLNINAYLPEKYIPDGRQKIDIYKAVAAAKSEAEVGELEAEIRDRFGHLPREARNLLSVARIKILLREVGLESMRQRGEEIWLEPGPGFSLPLGEIQRELGRFRRRLLIDRGRKPPRITVRIRDLEDNELLDLLLEILTALVSLAAEEGIGYNETSTL